MKLNLSITVSAIAAVMAMMGCDKDEDAGVKIISATGDISAQVAEFRALAGTELNTTPDAPATGRREINWDGVPDELLDQQLPPDFFNPTTAGANPSNQRGLKYSPTGNFRVSANRFSSINPIAAPEFEAFSGNKTFANLSSALWDVEFQVAGRTDAAAVSAMGIVFADVDKSNTTFIEYYDGTTFLGKYFVPAHEAGSHFSFIGVKFTSAVITRIRVGHEGTLQSGEPDVSGGGTSDLVVMDDFIYSEPVAR